MNNRYNYDRRRSYGNRNSSGGSGVAGFIVTLIGITIILGIWVISLKSDIGHLSDDKFLLMMEKNELKHKMDSITKTLQIPVKEVVVEKKSKISSNNKVFKNKSEKDTIKIKVEKIENKPILVDSTGL